MNHFIRIHPEDNVAVALAPLSKGETISFEQVSVTLLEDIPQGHKFALTGISTEGQIVKYGSLIGHAVVDIAASSWVHTHNIKTNLGDLLSYTYDKINCPQESTEERFFQGYRRKDGKTDVRNEIWIIPTVGCVNNIATAIERQAQQSKLTTLMRFPLSRIHTAALRWEMTKNTHARFL